MPDTPHLVLVHVVYTSTIPFPYGASFNNCSAACAGLWVLCQPPVRGSSFPTERWGIQLQNPIPGCRELLVPAVEGWVLQVAHSEVAINVQ